MSFRSTVALDGSDYRAFTEVLLHHRLRFLLLLGTAATLFLALTGWFSSPLSLTLVAMALVLLAVYLFRPRALAAQRRRVNDALQGMTPLAYEFADSIVSTHAIGTFTFAYTDITRLVESETLLVLFCGKDVIAVLPKASVSDVAAFKAFIAEKTGRGWKTVVTARNARRRALAAFLTVILAVGAVTAMSGVTYIRRDVSVRDGDNVCTLSLPYFLEKTGENIFEGNGLTATAKLYKNGLTLDKLQTQVTAEGLALHNGVWLEDGENERYMQYTDGTAYVCVVLHETEHGTWCVRFTCPGERQDTYYNRFNTWRSSAEYHHGLAI